MAIPDSPPKCTWSNGGILMSASPPKRVEALRRLRTRNQTARIHELCPVIALGAVWQDEDPVCQAFFPRWFLAEPAARGGQLASNLSCPGAGTWAQRARSGAFPLSLAGPFRML